MHPRLILLRALPLLLWACTSSSTSTQDAVSHSQTLDTRPRYFRALPSPQRILDTRDAAPGFLWPGESLALAPAVIQGADAVAIGLTVAGSTEAGYLTLFPCSFGGPNPELPLVSMVNFQAGETVASSTIVPTKDLGGGARQICVFNSSGQTPVILDVMGLFTQEGGSGYVALSAPVRVLDTRLAGGRLDGSAVAVGLAGAFGIPSNATAVAVNLTSTGSLRGTFLTLFPSQSPVPLASNVNVAPFETRANAGWVGLGSDGAIAVFSSLDSEVIIDVAGYFVPGGGSAFVPLPSPTRILDSRDGLGRAGSWTVALPAGTPGNITAAAVNVAAVSASADGYLTFASDVGSSSNLNFVASQTVANSAIVKPGGGTVSLYASSGGITDAIMDVTGFFVAQDMPRVRRTTPADGATAVGLDVTINAELILPDGAVDAFSLNAQSVRLLVESTGAAVSGTVTTSGGGDTINFRPNAKLAAKTRYSFVVSEAVRDIKGRAFLSFRSAFATGEAVLPNSAVSFSQVRMPATDGVPYTSVVLGPDGRLYAGSLTGSLYRYDIAADGTLSNRFEISTVPNSEGAPRYLIGMAFAPGSSAQNPTLYVTHTAFYDGSSVPPDWSGKLSRLTGANLSQLQDVVVGFPRSVKDHVTNSIAFDPKQPNLLYIAQGSNSAMGAADATWGMRPERVLSGNTLQLDLGKLSTLPLNVKTAEGGTYDAYGANAPLKHYAFGVRNAFDVLVHSNGGVYTVTNSSSSGGNSPAIPAQLPANCARRSDGSFAGGNTPALNGITVTPEDFIYRLRPGGYYGHPNVENCYFAFNGGNPTGGGDAFEITDYPVGTAPDKNYRAQDIFPVGLHASANGAAEYRSGTFGPAFQGSILVARFAVGSDLVALTVNPQGRITEMKTGITGFTGLRNPLDLVVEPNSGRIYVSELDQFGFSGSIVLLKPKTP